MRVSYKNLTRHLESKNPFSRIFNAVFGEKKCPTSINGIRTVEFSQLQNHMAEVNWDREGAGFLAALQGQGSTVEATGNASRKAFVHDMLSPDRNK